MLTRLDDYPLHQTPSDGAAGHRRPQFLRSLLLQRLQPRGDFLRGGARVYPNRRVMDAAFSIVQGGRQWVVRASRLAPLERTETIRRPDHVEVVEPLRVLRLRVAPIRTGRAPT